MQNENLSKIMSHALRHRPEDYNLKLSDDGWVSIDELVKGIRDKVSGYSNLVDQDIIDVVAKAIKKRHQISSGRIRALHGHSVEIGGDNMSAIPPGKLFHATAQKYLKEIKVNGLNRMRRNYVHLSTHKQGAIEVAEKKYKRIVLLQIDATMASEDGILFYNNDENLTWLCDHVPSKYISIPIEG
ncbi:MAG: RNA 2'-phosphotransferase [Sphingobacteriales bacterium]|nr:RNA 2'-phosphotransferase [Sphingobacteriales bacterium]